ncbi:MAG: hypothetical protein Aurels2KO_34580 [Aureliella sp.]
MSAGDTGGPAEEIDVKKKGEKPKTSSLPKVDLFGMAISSEGEKAGNRSNIRKKQEFFVACKFLKSQTLENGDVVGQWLSANEFSIATIRFGSKVAYMPVETVYHLWDKEFQKPGDQFSQVKTKLQTLPGKKAFVPSEMIMVGGLPQKDKIEVQFDTIRWLAPEAWSKSDIDFSRLATSPMWRDRFLSLFEASK